MRRSCQFLRLTARGDVRENRALMMRKLIYTFLVAGVSVGLVSCDSKEPQQEKPNREETVTPEKMVESVVNPAPTEESEAALPEEQAVLARLLPELADYPAVRADRARMDAVAMEDGSVMVTAQVTIVVGENLYTKEAAPEVFNAERRAMNDAMNRAMLPEAHYLLQVGAETKEISDEDRQVRPLSEDLQKQADEIRELAEQPVYHLRTPANSTQEIPASMKARKENGQWSFSELSIDTATLQPLVNYIPEAALPEGAAVVSEGFEDSRRAALREKIAAFIAAAEPGIQAREDAARTRVVETRARQGEEAKAAAEQAARQAAAHEAWEKLCGDYVRDGAVFEGEWKRGDDFGKISLRISRTQAYPEAVQFTGVLSDPALPQVELQIVGRVEQAASAQEPAPVTVHIYNGRYDSNVPTAEVFDAKDSMLKLHMAENGAMSGLLTCAAWSDSPDKAFSVSLSYTPKKAPRRAAPARAR